MEIKMVEPKQPQPDVMPPEPDVKPGPDLPEIPQDKNAPQKQVPLKMRSTSGRAAE
jgi:hypothetical protein